MTLTEKLRAELKEAMRSKDELRLAVIRSMLAAFTNELVAKGKKPTDVLEEKDELAVLKRLMKQRKDSAEQFTAGNRPELAEKEQKESEIISEFMPQMASMEEIENAAKEVIAEQGADASKAGVLVGMTMKKLGGNADGSDVKEVIAKLLN